MIDWVDTNEEKETLEHVMLAIKLAMEGDKEAARYHMSRIADRSNGDGLFHAAIAAQEVGNIGIDMHNRRYPR